MKNVPAILKTGQNQSRRRDEACRRKTKVSGDADSVADSSGAARTIPRRSIGADGPGAVPGQLNVLKARTAAHMVANLSPQERDVSAKRWLNWLSLLSGAGNSSVLTICL